MRDRDHCSLLSDNEYAYMSDGVIRDAGLFSLREGRTAKSQAAGAYPQDAYYFEPTPGQGRIIQFNQGIPYQWQGASGWARIGTLLVLTNTTDPVTMAALNGRIYVFPGTSGDHVWSWDGTSADWTDESSGNTNPPFGGLACVQADVICASGVASSASIAGTNLRDYIFFSNTFPSSGSGWDIAARNRRIPTDGSEPCLALGVYRDLSILALTRNSTHVFDMSSGTPSTYVRKTLDPKVGCIAPKTVVCVGEDVFFLSGDKQLRTIKRSTQDQAYGVSVPVSFNVPNLFDRITASAMSKACATMYNNYLLLAVPVDGATYNNSIFVFDLLLQTQAPFGYIPVCVGEWTNMRVAKFVTANFNNVPQLYYVDSTDGTLFQMFNGQQDDDGAFITCTMKSRGFQFKNPRCDKTIRDLEYTLIGTQGSLSISYARDDAAFNSLITGRSYGGTLSPLLPVSLSFTLPDAPAQIYDYLSFHGKGRSRTWQVLFSFNGPSFSLKEFALAGWVHAMKTR